ncbi:MAG: radical SAM protein, partial [Promethearchaeota archaeon]
MQVERIALVDGYVDEPTCLGVPPYVSIYPRYIAGAVWTEAPKTEILYQTIDQVRESFKDAQRLWSRTDLIILIAGMIVPGKYVGGTPISVREARELFSGPELENIPKVLVGPWARFGCGLEGGKLA